MSKRNRHTTAYRNRISLPTLAVCTLLIIAVAGILVNFLMSRNRLSALAAEQRLIEQQIALYIQEIQAIDKRIDACLTRDKIEARLSAHTTFLKPVEPENIIVLHPVQLPDPQDPTPADSSIPSLAQNQPPL
jgi:hypothetical protein